MMSAALRGMASISISATAQMLLEWPLGYELA